MKTIDEEVQELAGHLPVAKQKILKNYLEREEADPNNGHADYVYGQDDEFAEAGAPNFN